MNEDFYYNVYAIVEEIPKGSVATYQLIAHLIGHERNSRLVGRALRFADIYGDFPCHRVVHSDGRLVEGWLQQKELLEDEGVTFLKNGKVDMRRHLWRIDID